MPPKESTLGEYFEVIMGQSPDGESCSSERIGPPLLNGPSEFGLTFPTPIQYTSKRTKIAKPGDLLFCVRGSTTGRMNWADQEYVIGRGLAAIRSKKNLILNHLARALLEVNLQTLLAAATGSTFPNVSRDQLLALRILQPEDTQSCVEIANFLKTICDKIELNRKMNETLEKMARAIFKSWFIDFDPVHAKRQGTKPFGMDDATAALFPDSFEQSELGEIPKGWQVTTIGEQTSRITKGTTPTTLKKSFVESGICFVKVESLDDNGEVKPDKFAYIDSETDELLARSRLTENDILVSIAGTIGRVCLMEKEFLPANTNQAVAIITPCDFNQRYFLYHCLRTSKTQQFFHERVIHAVQANLSLGMLAKTRIILPDPAVLISFSSVISQLHSLISSNRIENRTLSTTRDLLLPRLLSGELTIKEATS
jgi:type I restriction enzyme S subunit